MRFGEQAKHYLMHNSLASSLTLSLILLGLGAAYFGEFGLRRVRARCSAEVHQVLLEHFRGAHFASHGATVHHTVSPLADFLFHFELVFLKLPVRALREIGGRGRERCAVR